MQDAVLVQTPFFNQVIQPVQMEQQNSSNPFSVSYQENQVFTASREELILMLYDGVAKFLRRGMQAIDDKDDPAINYNFLRAQKIVHYLDISLDMDKGGEIAENLARLYQYINRRLTDCQMKQTRETVQEIMELVHTLRQAWYQAFLGDQQSE
ncbi:flagellar export chaperone FliS [bacterium]|nr:flagellar export chaperone FliS [bacterium]